MRTITRPLLALPLLVAVAACTTEPSPVTPPGDGGFVRLGNARKGITSVSLLAAHTDASGTQWVGGDVGVLLSRSGNGDWQLDQVPGTGLITGIWSAADGDLFVAAGTSLLRRGDATWQLVPLPGSPAILLDIWGLDADHAWITGTGGTILRRDGGGWARGEVPVTWEVWGVTGSANDDLAAVGQNGLVLHSVDGGATWQRQPSPTGATLFAVATNASGRMVAVGSGGTILVRDGDTWELTPSPTGQALFDVRADGGDGFIIAGNAGLLLRGSGLTWQVEEVRGARENLRAITGPPGARVVAGWQGTILSEPGGWTTSETGTRIYGVHAPADGPAIAVGQGGTGLIREAGGWRHLAIPAPASLFAIDGPSATARMAVGDSGTVLRLDGGTWHTEQVPSDGLLRSVWYDGERALVVGAGGEALVREGGAWRTVPTGTGAFLRRVNGNAWSRLWVAGDSGTLLRWNGDAFTAIDVPTAHHLRGVFERHARDVWVVGDVGTILRFDGWSWKRQFPPVLNDIRAIHGVGSDIYVVGDLGLAYRLSGGEWSVMQTSQLGFWLDADGAGELVVVGENGTVAEGQR